MWQVLIFANPIAGRGRGRTTAQLLRHELSRRNYDPVVFLNKADSASFNPSHDIAAAIVIGGDGTLRSVAQWAIDNAYRLQREPYPLLIVPMGTANLMGKHLGISWDPQTLAQQVADSLDHGQIVHLDAARTNQGIFLLMASVGFDAWVVHELDRIRSGPISISTYILPILRGLAEYDFPPITVTVDNKIVFADTPGLALAGNVREYGAGFPLLPHARPDDQLLDVCVMPCSSRRDLMRLLLAAAAGQHVHEEGVIYLKGKSIRIDSPNPVPVQVDGEPAGATPVDIDLLPTRIPFIVPPRSDVS